MLLQPRISYTHHASSTLTPSTRPQPHAYTVPGTVALFFPGHDTLSAVLYTIGSCGFLFVDVQEWFTFKGAVLRTNVRRECREQRPAGVEGYTCQLHDLGGGFEGVGGDRFGRCAACGSSSRRLALAAPTP